MKRKILALCLALMLVLTALPVAGLASTSANVKMPNSGGSLNLRTGPGKSYGVAGYVKDGQAIVVKSIDEVWAKVFVTSSAKTGYIKNKYIVYGNYTGAYLEISGGGSLHLRKGKGTNTASLGYVHDGDKVTVKVLDDTWSKIVADGKTGYLKTKYLRVGSKANPTVIVDGKEEGGGGGSSEPVSGGYDVAAVYSRNGGAVHLRKGAGSGYGSLGELSKGTKLKIYGMSGDWCKTLTFSGLKGYMHKNYVSYSLPAYTSAKVNLRSNAGTGYGVKTTLAKGTRITVHSVDGNWARVTTGSYSGYIHTSYFKYY